MAYRELRHAVLELRGLLAESNYYHFDPATMGLSDVLTLWVREGKKAYDGTFLLPVEDVWPYREYTWTRHHNRAGMVPDLAGGKRQDMPGGPERWDKLIAYMKAKGWDEDDPGTLVFGKNGQVKVGEGNHRLALAREAGIKTVPFRFDFYQSVQKHSQFGDW